MTLLRRNRIITGVGGSRRRGGHAAVLALLPLAMIAGQANAANSNGCVGGGFQIVTGSGVTAGPFTGKIAAATLGSQFQVKGKYTEFTVVSATFETLHYTLTGAANPLDITGGVRTEVFASKTPDHRGLTLSGDMTVELSAETLLIERTGAALSMKIEASDCANGGLFQMEPQRGDGATTNFTHTLAAGVFYFDNPNFRQQANAPTLPVCQNGVFTPACVPVAVTPRINFANDVSRNFVGRDSPQVATRITNPACRNVFPGPGGTTQNVAHCGGVSVWLVASGGRMGGVMGEDSVEVAPPATACVSHCQAQDRVRGRFPVLGFPFPVPDSDRLKPRFP
jgi:hypothetical protein